MRTLGILAAMSLLIGGLLAGCGDPQDRHPTAIADPGATAAAKAGRHPDALASAGLDPAFLAALDAAFTAMVWEPVALQSDREQGSLVGYPASFAAGHYVELLPLPGSPPVADLADLTVLVPASASPTPGGCVLFRFLDLPAGASFAVRTFLPAWVDAGDLGARHATYLLDGGGDGPAAVGVKLATTPPAPWLAPPVEFVVEGGEPGRGDGDKGVVDPGDPGDG